MADYEENEDLDAAKEGDDEPEDDSDLLAEAKERFQQALSYYSEEYVMAQNDQNFAYGDQWPDDIRSRRRKEFRPCLTQNQCLPFVHQVVNDIKQSRPTIRVSPVDDQADIETADVLKGMIRNIEVVSNAENAYDRAAMNSVSCGYGWLRVNTDYVDETSFEKEICIDAPLNPFSVLIDPNHKKQDGSDMEWAFIYDDVPEDDFTKMYPDATPVDFDGEGLYEWRTEDTVRIAEYFYKEYTAKTIVQTSDGQIWLKEEMPEGLQVVNEREVQLPQVKWCKLSGNEVLERTDWEGKYIPLIPVYGEIVWNEGRRRAFSLIHQAIDPQQMLNYWLTANTEIVALQPKAPYIGVVGQFKSKYRQWMNANTTNAPFLEYDPVSYEGQLVGAPQRQAPPQGSAAMTQGVLMAVEGIKSSLGIFDASLGQHSNETSGKAILARQQEGDNATYHFMDNLSVGMRHVGMILIDMIPKVYSGKRIARIIGDDGEEKNIPLNQPFMKDQSGNLVPAGPETPQQQYAGIYNLDVGKYDVVVDVGPSYATKRQEVVSTMLELVKADPTLMAVAGDILFKNMDVPQAKELADRVKSKMDPALFGDDPNAQKLQQAAQMIQGMQQQMAQMDAALKAKQDDQAHKNSIDQQKADAETAKTHADIEKIRAETAKTEAEVAALTSGVPQAQALTALMDTLHELDSRVSDVEEAVHHILSAHESQLGAPEQVPSMPENNMDANQPTG